MAEADGTRHTAHGRYLSLDRPRELRFRLDPVGSDGKPLFGAEHEVGLTRHAAGTRLRMAAHVTGIAGEAAVPALAGMRIGWEQSLDKLAEHLRA